MLWNKLQQSGKKLWESRVFNYEERGSFAQTIHCGRAILLVDIDYYIRIQMIRRHFTREPRIAGLYLGAVTKNKMAALHTDVAQTSIAARLSRRCQSQDSWMEWNTHTTGNSFTSSSLEDNTLYTAAALLPRLHAWVLRSDTINPSTYRSKMCCTMNGTVQNYNT